MCGLKKAGSVNSRGVPKHSFGVMISFYLALAAAVAVPTDGATTDPTVEQIVMRVDYSDLELRTLAGQSEFRRRVRHAEAKACDDGPGPKTQAVWRQIFACKQLARREASRAIERATAGAALAGNSPGIPKL